MDSDAEVFVTEGRKGTDSDVQAWYISDFQTLDVLHPLEGQTRIVRKIARWKDPFTVPKSRSKCVKWCTVTGHDKWCCGWKVQWTYMYCDLYLEVRTSTPQDIVDAVEDCLKDAAIASAIAAIVTAALTGGAALPAAKAAFISAFTRCISEKLSNIVSIELLQSCGWGNWE